LAAVEIATPVFPQKSMRPLTANASSMQELAIFSGISEQAPVTTTANPSEPIVPSYPNTPEGLEKLMKDVLKLEKQNNQQELAAYLKSMTLPDADNWFKSVFGETRGANFASASAQWRKEFESSAPDALATFLKRGLTDVEAVRFDDSCNRRATATEYPFLLLRERPEPLYDVRFHESNTGTVVTYFAYVDGAFRYIGSLKKTSAAVSYKPNKAPSAPDQRADMEDDPKETLKIGNEVQMARLIHREVPEYPPDAKARGIKGTVLLHAIIAKDGSVKDLEVSEGICSLAVSALHAVKKWRYKPTMLNGNPVEVDTTISVVFTLGN
jgi:TonB family protein